MAWTVPITFIDGSPLTAPQMNTFLRDNMLETAPAKAYVHDSQYEISTFVTMAVNSIGTRSVALNEVATAESTDSDSWVDLNTTGPQCTVTTGERALYFFTAKVSNTASDATSFIGVDVSGAGTIEAKTSRGTRIDGVPAVNSFRVGSFHLESNLTPGENTFKMVYACATGSATFSNRNLVVIPL